jgi:hypothetical protein
MVMSGTPQWQLIDLYLRMQGTEFQDTRKGKKISINFDAIINIKVKETWREDKGSPYLKCQTGHQHLLPGC